jgi:hypothetical protein
MSIKNIPIKTGILSIYTLTHVQWAQLNLLKENKNDLIL